MDTSTPSLEKTYLVKDGRLGPPRSLAFLLALACLALAGDCAPKARAEAARPASEALPGLAAWPAEAFPARALAELPPFVPPPWPDFIPGYTEVDPATGLHMTGKPVRIDIGTWRLDVTGAVRQPRRFSYDELRMLPGLRQKANLVCPGFFSDTAEWAGASIDALLRLVEPDSAAKELVLEGADGYSASIDLATARSTGFLAYSLDAATLPVLHGFPLRGIFPTRGGSVWVKWLVAIRLR